MLVGLPTTTETTFFDIHDGTGEMAQPQNGQYGEYMTYLRHAKRSLA